MPDQPMCDTGKHETVATALNDEMNPTNNNRP